MCELLAIYPCSCFYLPLAGGLVGWRFVFLLFYFFWFFVSFFLLCLKKFLMCVVSLILECTLSSSVR